MPVVRVREMRMAVHQRRVMMRMTVAGARWHRWLVRMRMMRVARAVRMFVRVRHWLVPMPVFMSLPQVQGNTDGHQGTGQQQRRRDRFT